MVFTFVVYAIMSTFLYFVNVTNLSICLLNHFLSIYRYLSFLGLHRTMGRGEWSIKKFVIDVLDSVDVYKCQRSLAAYERWIDPPVVNNSNYFLSFFLFSNWFAFDYNGLWMLYDILPLLLNAQYYFSSSVIWMND